MSQDSAADTGAGTAGDTAEHRTFCRFCSALCGVVVTTRGDEVIGVRGDPEHPFTRGYTCPKGRALGAWHHHPRRLDEPLLGRPGEGRTAPGWDAVLEDLAARMGAVASEHGPDAVGMYMATAMSFDSAGGRVANRFFQTLGSRSKYTAVTIDTPCRPLVFDLMAGHAGLMPCFDPPTAGLTLLVGTNPVASHGHTTSLPDPVTRLRELAGAPRELWVIDPRRTETARLATRHLAPRPGTDHAVLAHVVRELLGPDGGADHEYLDRHATGVDDLRAAVEPWDLDRSAAVSGLDPTELTELVAAVRRHGRVAAITGTGVTMSAGANAAEWLTWALQVVTGSPERPGGVWFQPGFLRCFDRRDLNPSPPEPVAYPRPPSRPDLPGFYGEYPCAALVDEIESGNLRALLVVGGNPATSLPESARLERALAGLEVLAVADVIHTETTDLATHVLPSVGQLERADVPDFVDQYYPAVASHYTPAVLAPGAERRPVWWSLGRLAELMGRDAMPGGLTPDTASDDLVLDTFANRGRLPLDELRASPTAVVAEGPVRGWVHDRVLPDGRWRIAPRVLVDELARAGSFEPPGDDDLVLVSRRLLRTMNSQLRDAAAPGARLAEPLVLVHPDDAAARELDDGAAVRIRSANGETTGTLRVDDGIRPGTVSVPHGWADTRVSSLTSGRVGVDPVTGMVLQTGILVSVEAASGPA